VECIPEYPARAPTIQAVELYSPPIEGLLKHGNADLLARQQEEYDEYLIEGTANGMPAGYVVRLRAAQQAARNAASSTTDNRRSQYLYWPTMWVAVAIMFFILLFLKLRYS
jgi:hypothetical protein